MNKLTLETFLSSGPDPEANQYRILGILKGYHDEFSHNRLYPPLAELIELTTVFESLIKERSNLQNHLPHHLKDVDLENKRLIFEPTKSSPSDIEKIIELVAWVLPFIRKAIEEGVKIYDFADENLSIEEVGILPVYREEGYCFVPENRSSLLHLIRYQVSLFTSGDEKFRTLKTHLLRSVHSPRVSSSPESIKLELIEENRDLPNPATYVCETDLEFPFAETIFPIAKRKLMARIAA